MADAPNRVFRTTEEVLLIGTMATYESQAEASQRLRQQWREFRRTHPALTGSSPLYGASPCTGDRKIHYLTGVVQQSQEDVVGDERLTLEAGEFAGIPVSDTALLRDTWIWLLRSWLPTSSRHKKNSPVFERFTGIPEAGHTRRTGRNLDTSRTTSRVTEKNYLLPFTSAFHWLFCSFGGEGKDLPVTDLNELSDHS